MMAFGEFAPVEGAALACMAQKSMAAKGIQPSTLQRLRQVTVRIFRPSKNEFRQGT